jgi:hypothetical protein
MPKEGLEPSLPLGSQLSEGTVVIQVLFADGYASHHALRHQISVPCQIGWMRMEARIIGNEQLTAGSDQALGSFGPKGPGAIRMECSESIDISPWSNIQCSVPERSRALRAVSGPLSANETMWAASTFGRPRPFRSSRQEAA